MTVSGQIFSKIAHAPQLLVKNPYTDIQKYLTDCFLSNSG